MFFLEQPGIRSIELIVEIKDFSRVVVNKEWIFRAKGETDGKTTVIQG